MGYDPLRLSLSHNGHHIHAHDTMDTHALTNGSVIHASFRVQGGGPSQTARMTPKSTKAQLTTKPKTTLDSLQGALNQLELDPSTRMAVDAGIPRVIDHASGSLNKRGRLRVRVDHEWDLVGRLATGLAPVCFYWWRSLDEISGGNMK